VLPSEARQWRNDSFHIGILLEKSSDFVQETQPICKVCVFRLARAGKKRSPVPNLFWCGGRVLESECPPGIFARPRFLSVIIDGLTNYFSILTNGR
jgi:hypothetical protein